jgi:hypothetical protein
MQIKAHEEYDPSNYASYAITSIKEDFTINLLYPSGFIEYVEYDLYDIGDQFLIAFYHLGMFKTNFKYLIVSENKIEEINHENYEFLIDTINGTEEENKVLFVIFNSVINLRNDYDPDKLVADISRRCDLDEYGAVAFHDLSDGIKDFPFDISYFMDSNLKSWTSYLNSMGNIHIVKLSFKHMPDEGYMDWPICIGVNRTLMGCLKSAYYWAQCADEPWNSQESIAQKCKNAMIDFNFSEEIISEIEQFNFPTVLERFLSNDSEPRRKIEEDQILPPNFKNWFISTLRYRTLGSLSSIHPLSPSIPQALLDKENQFFESEIYSFCLSNSLDLETVTMIEIAEKAHTRSYKEENNTITDIIKKYMLTNPDLNPQIFTPTNINNEIIGQVH